ncbi:MAG: V-type ATP synthase subunit C [Limnochordia bacterium]|jgi:V/A-type H+-transporting ATPase subunit C
MGKYAYAVARIRAMETRLLDKGKIGRMLEARDAEGALRVLSESEYADSLAELPAPSAYEELLNAELRRVYAVVEGFAPDDGLFDLLRSRYDFHNLKVLLKARHLGLERDDLLVDLGRIEPQRLKEQLRTEGGLPPELRETVQRTEEEYSETGDPQLLDLVPDYYMYDYMYKQGQALGDPLIVNYLVKEIDLLNIKTCIRLKRIGGQRPSLDWLFLPHGTVDLRLLQEALREPWDSLAAKFSATEYAAVVQEGLRYLESNNSLTGYEALAEAHLLEHMRTAKYVAFGPEPISAYLLAKELETRLIRMIMVGKINNLPQEAIRERLSDVYA